MSIRSLLPIFLLSASCYLNPANAELTAKAWSFDTNAEVKNKRWSYSTQKPEKDTIKANYFYVTPNNIGATTAGYFRSSQIGNQAFWVDTGSLIFSRSLGGRYLFNSSYFNQHWFCGAYHAFAYHGDYHINYQSKTYARMHLGLEIGGSRWGQLTINTYSVPGTEQKNVAPEDGLWEVGHHTSKDKEHYVMQTYNATAKVYRDTQTMDFGGVSAKWVSIPTSLGQFSVMGAYVDVENKEKPNAMYFAKDTAWRIGLGYAFNVNEWAHVELQWTFLDKYDALSYKTLLPDCKIKVMGAKYHLEKDLFQGRLKRPAEYYAPLYADFSTFDWMGQQDTPQEIVEKYREEEASIIKYGIIAGRDAIVLRTPGLDLSSIERVLIHTPFKWEEIGGGPLNLNVSDSVEGNHGDRSGGSELSVYEESIASENSGDSPPPYTE